MSNALQEQLLKAGLTTKKKLKKETKKRKVGKTQENQTKS